MTGTPSEIAVAEVHCAPSSVLADEDHAWRSAVRTLLQPIEVP
jgi:hypothetical protein